jgi:hypothetical protein
MSIQRHYDGEELTSIYINGKELLEFKTFLAEIYETYTQEDLENILKKCPNLWQVIEKIYGE